MDTNQGRFVEEEQAESWMQRIQVGEIIKIKGEECRVEAIGSHIVTLKLLNPSERAIEEIFGERLKENK